MQALKIKDTEKSSARTLPTLIHRNPDFHTWVSFFSSNSTE